MPVLVFHLQFNRFPGTYIFQEQPVMLHQQQRRLKLADQRFYLHAAQHINVIERFIPHVQMRRHAQAASINWAISNVYSTSDSTQKAAAGTYTAMLFVTANSTDVTGLPTTTLAAVQDLLGKGDMASLSSLAAVTKQNTGAGLWSGATGLTGFSSGSLDAFAVVFDSTDVTSAEHYFIVNDGATKNATFTSATGMKNLAFGDQTAKSQGAWTAVPEPTSGLLMLLGMAGLALRRKRA